MAVRAKGGLNVGQRVVGSTRARKEGWDITGDGLITLLVHTYIRSVK